MNHFDNIFYKLASFKKDHAGLGTGGLYYANKKRKFNKEAFTASSLRSLLPKGPQISKARNITKRLAAKDAKLMDAIAKARSTPKSSVNMASRGLQEMAS